MAETKFHYKNSHAPTPNRPANIGVVAIIEMADKILLEKRTDSKRWAIIGGSIHDDESFLDGLYREVAEETGLKISAYELFGTFSDPSRIIEYPDGNVNRTITIAYRVEVEPFIDLVCSDESLELKLFDTAELEKITIAETHTQIIDQYKRINRGIVYD